MVQQQDAPQRVPWRHSLFFRVVLLCGVLLLCLLGSVFAITRHYFNVAVQEMELKAEEITTSIQEILENNPNIDDEALADEIRGLYTDSAIEIATDTSQLDSPSFRLEQDRAGHMTRVGVVPVDLGVRQVVMTIRASTATQIEILRAFKNRYILLLTAVFLGALGLMVYLIAKSLRPLTELSNTCAAISTGDLKTVATHGAYGEILHLEKTFNSMVDALQEKELMETKLRQAQRLSALGNLAAGVAHDVRNPLNAIKLLSSHTLDMLPEGEDSPAAKPLHTIRDEVQRLEEIVSGFLSLAKESELHMEPQQVDKLLEECAHLIRKDAEERGVRLLSELRAGGTVLMLDPKQWSRAILNVLLNALEACPEGGRVRLFSRVTDRACEIEIRDDGPGMPKDEVERVFEPYYTTKAGGTGLGLSITRGIVQEHRGTIEITSREGQGSQVLITVPLEQTNNVS